VLRSSIAPGLFLTLWSSTALSQLLETAPSSQTLINGADIESVERMLVLLQREASRIDELEEFFQNDPVDSPWAEETERSLVDSLNSLGLDFRQLQVTCKTEICKVESEIRYGTVTALDMARRALYFDDYREIAQRGIGSVFRSDGSPLTRISGERGPVAVHYVYSAR
jgi:hypothetical protein